MPSEYISRSDWGAEPPQGEILPFKGKLTSILHVYFTSTKTCYNKEECSIVLKDLQQRSFRKGFPDIYYSFLVGGDGNVYEGRGWHFMPDLYQRLEDKLSERCISIAYIGDFTDEEPNLEQWIGGWKVIDTGLRNKYIDAENFRFYYCS